MMEINNNTISPEAIQNAMREKAKVFFYDIIDSTNAEAKRHIKEGLCSPAVFVAKEQTGGKGRQGKPFFSPPNTGLYMSVVVCPQCSFSDSVFLTTAAAVAVQRAIRKVVGVCCGIKWVNDLYYKNKKICGILAEAVNNYNTAKVELAIIGVGVNINTKSFPKDILDVAGSLDVDISMSELCAKIADEIFNIVASLPDKSFIDEYRQYSITIGKNITYIQNGKSENGFVSGIDNFGGLILDTPSGQVVLRSGEITIREHNENACHN